MSKREARIAALEHRRASEYQAAVTMARESLEQVQWGPASTLPEAVRLDILRLGGRPKSDAPENWSSWYRLGVEWPHQEFRWSERLFRSVLVNDGLTEAAEWSLEEVADEMLQCDPDFTFLKTMDEGFWSGWQIDFPKVDSAKFLPFGADGHFFYFIENGDVADPRVFSVDHEETGEEPYHSHLTVARLLSCLEPA